MIAFWRWPARWRCHGSILCCQHVDTPQCNSGNDPHWTGRWAWRRADRILFRQMTQQDRCGRCGRLQPVAWMSDLGRDDWICRDCRS